jgi:hypothetical protein
MPNAQLCESRCHSGRNRMFRLESSQPKPSQLPGSHDERSARRGPFTQPAEASFRRRR